MKYLRIIIGLSLITLLLSTGADGNSLSGKTAADDETRFFRVYFDNLDSAHKIVMSLNAIETRYENGYVTVEVTTGEEYRRLLDTGLKLEQIANPLVGKISEMKEAAIYQTEGIPSFPCYRTVEETFASAEATAAAYPALATWTDQGDSWEKVNGLGGYDMNVLKLTNSAAAGPKPKLFLTGAIHAREYATAELVTRFAEYLLANYGTDADATWLLDHHELHIMLQTNPDGRKKAETGLSWRKNTNQDYCGPDSNNRGADLNRNFEFKWACCGGSGSEPCSPLYHGADAASEPETQAVQNYMRSLFPDQRGPNDSDAAPPDATGVYLDIHSSGRLVLWPWGWTSAPAPNAADLQTFGRKMAYFNGHTPKQGYGLYPTDGTTKLFAYGELGIPGYTIELGTQFFQGCTYFENTLLPDNMPTLLYAFKVVRTPYKTPSGPDAVNITLSAGSTPTGVSAGTLVTLRASIDDTRYNDTNGTEPSQNIAAAEYYIDTPPWVISPVPIAAAMSASDGGFDSNREAVEGVIDTAGWSETQHIIFVRGRDTDGNWGAFSAVFLYIGDSGDEEPPVPDPMTWAAVPTPTGAGSISMTAVTASDPRGVEYYFQCLSPGGHDSGWQDSPTYVDTVSVPGKPYAYRVAARDKSASRNQTAWSQLKPVAWRMISPGHQSF
ncbi:MAG: carboxypeptidase [bacterium]|nr:carboxypeptidase [bacterium]